MTMIMGLNLSDRVYLSADTRVTYSDGKTFDDALKILPLLDRAIHGKTKTVAVAIAGNVSFATFLYNKLYAGFNKTKILNPDIREFYSMSKKFFEEALNDWIDIGNALDDGDVALIFSGVTDQRNKIIDPKKLKELVTIYEQKAIKYKERNGDDIEELVKTDPTWKMIDEKMKKKADMGVIENLALSSIPTIPDYIKNSIDTNNPNLDGYSDSLIFGTWLSIKNKKVTLEKAEWGEVLVYGDSVNKDSVTEDLLATLELSKGKQNNQPHIVESALMTKTVLDIAKDNHIASIGGTVIIVSSTKDGEMIIGKDIIFKKDKDTSVKINGTEMVLVPFDKYSLYSSKNLQVKM